MVITWQLLASVIKLIALFDKSSVLELEIMFKS